MSFESFDFDTMVSLVSQHRLDVGQGQAGITQQQDPLESRDCGGSVVAVAVGADPVRDQETDLVVVAQGPWADASPVREFADSPLHHRAPPVSTCVAAGPIVAGRRRGSRKPAW